METIIKIFKKYINYVLNSLVLFVLSLLTFKTYEHYEYLESKMKKLENTNELIKHQVNKTNITVLELSDNVTNYLNKINTSIKSLNTDILLPKQNDLILKILNKPNLPTINIVSDNSHYKVIIIGTCILFTVTAVVLYCYAPAIAVYTQKQILSLSLLANKIIDKIPGSNSAEGIYYLPEHHLQLITMIKSGHPTHKILDTLTQKEYALAEFLNMKFTTNLIDKTPCVINGVDISPLF